VVGGVVVDVTGTVVGTVVVVYVTAWAVDAV